MTPVDRMSNLLGALRQQLTAKTADRATAVSGTIDADSTSALASRVESMIELRKRMGREFRRFDLSSEAERKEARKMFVESVLSWDLGDAMAMDPRFSFIVREIEDTIGADEKSAADLDELIQTLKTEVAA